MKIAVFYLSCLLLLGSNLVFASDKPEIAPDFEVETTTNKTISLSQFRGQVVLLDFWASWCKPCQQEFPFLADLYRKNKAKKFTVLAVNLDEHEGNMKKFLSKMKWMGLFPIIPDPKGIIPTLYKIDRMPTTILIAPDGEIRYRHGGFDNSHKEELLRELELLLTEQSN